MSESEKDSASLRIAAFVGQLSRSQKRFGLMLFDALVVAFSLWLAVALRVGDLWPENVWRNGWLALIVLPVVSLVVFYQMGVYKLLLRSLGLRNSFRIIQATTINAILLAAAGYFFTSFFLPRSTPIIFVLVAVLLLVMGRWLARAVYESILNEGRIRKPVVIFGAGAAGMQLLAALKVSDEYTPVAFVDDDKSIKNTIVEGRPVRPREAIDK
ncbi:MAG: nucleoside-diphosphate sugar epimerase/dehydratase, partial [Beijerinckiaceae bacterium]